MAGLRVEDTPRGGLVAVRVVPGAARDGPAGLHGGALRLRVAAPATGGRANAAARALLADMLGVPASRVVLVRGATSRSKVFLVEGLAAAEVRRRLSPHLGG